MWPKTQTASYISDTPSIRSGFPRIRHIPVPSSPIIFDLGILLAYSTCNNQLKVRAYQADELSGWIQCNITTPKKTNPQPITWYTQIHLITTSPRLWTARQRHEQCDPRSAEMHGQQGSSYRRLRPHHPPHPRRRRHLRDRVQLPRARPKVARNRCAREGYEGYYVRSCCISVFPSVPPINQPLAVVTLLMICIVRQSPL